MRVEWKNPAESVDILDIPMLGSKCDVADGSDSRSGPMQSNPESAAVSAGAELKSEMDIELGANSSQHNSEEKSDDAAASPKLPPAAQDSNSNPKSPLNSRPTSPTNPNSHATSPDPPNATSPGTETTNNLNEADSSENSATENTSAENFGDTDNNLIPSPPQLESDSGLIQISGSAGSGKTLLALTVSADFLFQDTTLQEMLEAKSNTISAESVETTTTSSRTFVYYLYTKGSYGFPIDRFRQILSERTEARIVNMIEGRVELVLKNEAENKGGGDKDKDGDKDEEESAIINNNPESEVVAEEVRRNSIIVSILREILGDFGVDVDGVVGEFAREKKVQRVEVKIESVEGEDGLDDKSTPESSEVKTEPAEEKSRSKETTNTSSDVSSDSSQPLQQKDEYQDLTPDQISELIESLLERLVSLIVQKCMTRLFIATRCNDLEHLERVVCGEESRTTNGINGNAISLDTDPSLETSLPKFIDEMEMKVERENLIKSSTTISGSSSRTPRILVVVDSLAGADLLDQSMFGNGFGDNNNPSSKSKMFRKHELVMSVLNGLKRAEVRSLRENCGMAQNEKRESDQNNPLSNFRSADVRAVVTNNVVCAPVEETRFFRGGFFQGKFVETGKFPGLMRFGMKKTETGASGDGRKEETIEKTKEDKVEQATDVTDSPAKKRRKVEEECASSADEKSSSKESNACPETKETQKMERLLAHARKMLRIAENKSKQENGASQAENIKLLEETVKRLSEKAGATKLTVGRPTSSANNDNDKLTNNNSMLMRFAPPKTIPQFNPSAPPKPVSYQLRPSLGLAVRYAFKHHISLWRSDENRGSLPPQLKLLFGQNRSSFNAFGNQSNQTSSSFTVEQLNLHSNNNTSQFASGGNGGGGGVNTTSRQKLDRFFMVERSTQSIEPEAGYFAIDDAGVRGVEEAMGVIF